MDSLTNSLALVIILTYSLIVTTRLTPPREGDQQAGLGDTIQHRRFRSAGTPSTYPNLTAVTYRPSANARPQSRCRDTRMASSARAPAAEAMIEAPLGQPKNIIDNMIDLHTHLLPGVDDGAPDLATSLAMARIAAADGIEVMACTPHIYQGMYENQGPAIRQAAAELQTRLDEAGIALRLTHGADTHIAPDLVASLRSGRVPTLHDSRYFLLEPPHHVAPPRLEETVFNLLTAGYVPIITHPERLSWIEDRYEVFVELVRKGAWMQVTAGSLTGRFGADAKYWGERLLDEGWVHILATDAHGVDRRPPLLAEGQRAAERWVGAEEAFRLVTTRPRGILDNTDPESLTSGLSMVKSAPRASAGRSLLKTWFGRD